MYTAMRIFFFLLFFVFSFSSVKVVANDFSLNLCVENPEDIHRNTLVQQLNRNNLSPEVLNSLHIDCPFEITPAHWAILDPQIRTLTALRTLCFEEGGGFSQGALVRVFQTCERIPTVRELEILSQRALPMLDFSLGLSSENCLLRSVSIRGCSLPDAWDVGLLSAAMLQNRRLVQLDLQFADIGTYAFSAVLLPALLERARLYDGVSTKVYLGFNDIEEISVYDQLFNQLPLEEDAFLPTALNPLYRVSSVLPALEVEGLSKEVSFFQQRQDGAEFLALTLDLAENPIVELPEVQAMNEEED